jgi:hypothetical protein
VCVRVCTCVYVRVCVCTVRVCLFVCVCVFWWIVVDGSAFLQFSRTRVLLFVQSERPMFEKALQTPQTLTSILWYFSFFFHFCEKRLLFNLVKTLW